MNEIEKLSNDNYENYLNYLKRMTKSMQVSTKGLIPIMCRYNKNILDVGCGSGVLMNALEDVNPTTKITGIDLNEESINKLKALKKGWKLIHTDLMQLNIKDFDTIIFSSVLHEISSYCSNPSMRFTSLPIEECLKKSNELLIPDGNLIIRDGLLIDKNMQNEKVLITFKDINDSKWLFRFQNDFRGFDTLANINKEIVQISRDTFMVSLAFLKEFLYTFTWGEESYPREINERFGILEKNDWIRIIEENGYNIETIVEAKEEYERYLSPKVSISDINGNKFVYPMMVILIKASKNKSLTKKL